MPKKRYYQKVMNEKETLAKMDITANLLPCYKIDCAKCYFHFGNCRTELMNGKVNCKLAEMAKEQNISLKKIIEIKIKEGKENETNLISNQN